MRARVSFLAAILAFVGAVAFAEDIDGQTEYNGYKIIAPADIPPSPTPGDPGPTQTFEIIRPDARGIMLSRLMTSCECIQLEAEKAYFGDGERAFVRLRNVKPTDRKVYPFYVQVSSPEKVTLRYDATVQSDVPPAQ